MTNGRWLLLASSVMIVAACGSAPVAELLEARSGGDGSVAASSGNAFSLPSSLLDDEESRRFEIGNSLFTQTWLPAPSSQSARDGLGPLFNADACSSCHVADGRAARPVAGDRQPGLLVRLSVPGAGRGEAPWPEPTYGAQLQDRAVDGVTPEGSIAITHTEVTGTYGDGTVYRLMEPRYELTGLAHGPLDGAALTSPRIAAQIIGVGLLEAVPSEEVEDVADPDDADGDGISGTPNWIVTAAGNRVLGRFGWKASVASVADQVASAFAEDIGITNPLHGEEYCPLPSVPCREAPSGGDPEIDTTRFDLVVFYTQVLAVPERRRLDDPAVVAGSRLFAELRCTACHRPTLTTGDHPIGSLTGQVIHPYTDLLLHDMGPGLADGRPDHTASGTEWRTPPLWGIGLVETVNGHTTFLHDGRARSLEEAILWHGGEAAAAQDAFVALDAEDRAAVIAFLESL